MTARNGFRSVSHFSVSKRAQRLEAGNTTGRLPPVIGLPGLGRVFCRRFPAPLVA